VSGLQPIRKRGLANEERKLTPANVEAIRNLRAAGHSYEEIHRRTGFSDAAIAKYSKDTQPKTQNQPQTDPNPASAVVQTSSNPPPLQTLGGQELVLPVKVRVDSGFLLDAMSLAHVYGFSNLKEFWETVCIPSINFAAKIGEWVPHKPKDYDSLFLACVRLFQDAVEYREKVAGWRRGEMEKLLGGKNLAS